LWFVLRRFLRPRTMRFVRTIIHNIADKPKVERINIWTNRLAVIFSCDKNNNNPNISIIAKSSLTALKGLGATVIFLPDCFTLCAVSRHFFETGLSPMPLIKKHIRQLKSLAHHLKPIVILGKAGLGEPVLNEIDIALAHHELIKVKVNVDDREELHRVAEQITRKTSADLVQIIGHIIILYRPAEKPVIRLE
jgi:RNA-binding protein